MKKFDGTIRKLQEHDVRQVEEIFSLYWADGALRKKFSDKLASFVNNELKAIEQNLLYFVAEQNGEILGSLGFRKAPEPMLLFSTINNVAELYILAVKNRGMGVGRALIEKMLDESRKLGYTEIVLFNSDLHNEARGFYERLHFKRLGPIIASNGDPGEIWGIIL